MKRTSVSTLLALALGLTGCGPGETKVYTVAKEPTTPPPAAMPDGHPPLPSKPQLKWKLPAGWQEGAPSEFRLASFRIKGADGKAADLSVIPLPGLAGGDLSNVNRWRDQVGQPPITDDELKKLAQPVELAGQPAALYEQAGEAQAGGMTRILAVIQHRAGTAWFFKMTGDDKLVAEQKPVFIEFLKTFEFAAEAPALPAGHPDISAMPASTPSPNTGKPQWTPPAGWQEVAGGQFLVAKFMIEAGKAAVNVSSSPGDGGGFVANVNRWRKQLGLSEQTAPEITAAATTRGPVTFIELTGTDARSGQPAAVVAAMVQQPGQVWFYKLMGDAALVGAQKDAFTQFVQSVQY